MAFGHFWRGDRERFGGDRERERSTGSDWRSRGRERDWRGQGREDEREHGRYGEAGRERGWNPGGEYYSERSRGYGGGQEYRGEQGEGYRGQEEDYRQRGWRGGEGRQWGSQGRDWQSQGRDWGSEGRGEHGDRDYYGASGAMGYGAFGRDLEYGRRSVFGHGGYRGRGPRGYRRSDERIREDLCDALTDDPQIDASNMEVAVKDGEVTLTGTVNSREDKRRAEDIAESIAGVKDVHNSLRVSPQQQGAEAAQKGTTPGSAQSSRH